MIFDHVKTIEGIGEVGIFVIGTQGPFKDKKIYPMCNLHEKDTGKYIKTATVDWDNCKIFVDLD